MSATKLKKKLREARRAWSEARKGEYLGVPAFLDGVQRGFQEALNVIQSCHREELGKARQSRRAMSRWNAVILYRACAQACRRLQMSDRVGAIRTLERALSQVEAP